MISVENSLAKAYQIKVQNPVTNRVIVRRASGVDNVCRLTAFYSKLGYSYIVEIV